MSNVPTKKIDVAIIGGGIGGLATAVALNQAGFEAHVFEQAPEFGDVGGHLTIDTAAIEVLGRWGLDKKFYDVACELNGMEVRRLANGDVMAHFPLPDIGAMGVKDANRKGSRVIYSFLRPDFLGMLTDAIPADRLHTGHRLNKLTNGTESATAEFENGNKVTASIIIAADGVKSIARRMFDDSESKAAGHTILRTLCSADLLPADMPNDRMRFWEGWEFGDKEKQIGVHILTVPVREGKFISVDIQFMNGDQLEDCNPWDLPFDRIIKRFPENMDSLARNMLEQRLEPVSAHALYDRKVAKTWAEGCITLLGDAAHNMRPNLGQGACQSIHDAGELAIALKEHGLTTEALKAFESVRAPYVSSIVEVAMNTKVDPKTWKDKAKG